jgi:hypothetical protein
MEKSINNRVEDMLSEIGKRVEAGTMSIEEANKARQSLKSSKVEQIMGASLSPVKNLANLTKKAFDDQRSGLGGLEVTGGRERGQIENEGTGREGVYEGTSKSGVDVYSPTENTARPSARPEGLGRESSSSSRGSSSGGAFDHSGFDSNVGERYAKGGLVSRPKKSKKKC